MNRDRYGSALLVLCCLVLVFLFSAGGEAHKAPQTASSVVGEAQVSSASVGQSTASPDLNGDRHVDGADLLELLEGLARGDPFYDLSGDYVADYQDLFDFASWWGVSQSPTPESTPSHTPALTPTGPTETPSPTATPGLTETPSPTPTATGSPSPFDLAEYFPLRIGNRWTYSQDISSSTYTVIDQRVERIGPLECHILKKPGSETAYSWDEEILYLVQDKDINSGFILSFAPPLPLGDHDVELGEHFIRAATFEGYLDSDHFTGVYDRTVVFDRLGHVTVPAGDYPSALHVRIDDEVELTFEGGPTNSETWYEEYWLVSGLGRVWLERNEKVGRLVDFEAGPAKGTGLLKVSESPPAQTVSIASRVLDLARRSIARESH